MKKPVKKLKFEQPDSSYLIINEWFKSKSWQPFEFQRQAWQKFDLGKNGLVNAPTGSGKTYALLVPIMLHALRSGRHEQLTAIWITPIRALAKEIELAAKRLFDDCAPHLTVGVRTGDTSAAERQRQNRKMPTLLITTPESLHLLIASKTHQELFRRLNALVIDEWHELLGSKRGVQMELARAYLKSFCPSMRVWGISATVGNMEEAIEVLVGPQEAPNTPVIKSMLEKQLEVETLLPPSYELLPWAGHIGLRLAPHVSKVIEAHTSTLIFTNTRAQCEIWYRQLLEADPELVGRIAMHHSALTKELRNWVEDALYEGRLKAVVCTSSLDLGVDFRPVDAVVQIGGPKGVARFMQRAGRSGHAPGATSKIWFLPTHAIELIEAAALRSAIGSGDIEERQPYLRSFDVLIQFITTLAVGGGADPRVIRALLKSTCAFSSVNDEELNWCFRFLTTGGESLEAYPEFKKLELKDGCYHPVGQTVARRHRMSIGTIVGDTMVEVKYRRGARIGFVEEYFAAGMREGDVFWFAGRSLEVLAVNGLRLEVKNTKKKSGRIPAWQGGRLPLSSMLAHVFREKLSDYLAGKIEDVEIRHLAPLLELQRERSLLPHSGELLIEVLSTREGNHVFVFPFEGRLVHEGLASLMAWRLSQITPVSFSMAFNDYGFELLTDQPLPWQDLLTQKLFTTEHLVADLAASVNSAELARRKFRDIAVISGLLFRGYPGQPVKDKHLQSSSSLVYDVFESYDSNNLLLRQAYDEMLAYQLEIERFRKALERVKRQKIELRYPEKPTPLAFPIMVDRLRERLSSEKLEDRIARMQIDFGN